MATIKTSVLGAINLLDLAKQVNLKYSKHQQIYGDPTVHPQVESYWGINPIGPRSCYDEGKRCAETLFFDYRRQYNLDVRVGRLFNSYGPNMQINDGRVISNFIVQALKNQNITIYGTGRQTRSFCFVDDMIDGIFAFFAQKQGEIPVNIGNPFEMTIHQLARKIIELCNSKSKVEYHPLPLDDPHKRCPDITEIKRLTGWQTKVDFETGVSKTINYFEKKLIEGVVN